jgi:glutaconate CoA-transferase subunit B
MKPDPATKAFTVASIHPGVTREEVADNTGWKLAFASDVGETPAPSAVELEALRALNERTAKAHGIDA